MNLTEKELGQLGNFMLDPVTPQVVYKVILQSFLKRKVGEDTNMKAARFVATELLEDAWKTLEAMKPENEINGSTKGQIGL